MKWPDVNVSNDTRRMLDKLIEKKRDWDKLKKTQWFFVLLTGGIIFYFIVNFYHKVLVVSGGNAIAILDHLTSNKVLSGSLVAGISLFMFTRNRVARIEKAKGKYEDLRKEAVERLDADWLRDVKSEDRDKISSFMDQEYDINIVYKS
ncbi:DUF2663 family protein [Paenibacillus sp. GCM10023248]|nr:DUF2663 family protein [Paenibacillus sp. MAHUQ-63]MDD9265870.1 DUF2663 family protein [Paenibacillus sp. MAHUQ-63]MDR6879110.1 hypothetical protein [Bacillus sp. 3255]